ncbi:MAG: hypothetical protein AVDCRST_MAG26-2330 [uncultured Chloroflexia bacterium]|uniref:Uncharacterized protein n=1 Tax=uncultured Chloroflexia bacterium TaxID=1672391 RepID=A0A6J4IX15_9CHLR|nr:MAG: hypothetical protein AVDCRST_MAG26-2330 [uncultured Chloroflexia bacterium]
MTRHQASRAGYCSYLLRCWQELGLHGSGPGVWRFSLEDPQTGALRGFASFEALVAFLHAQLLDEPLAVHSAPSGNETG